MTAKIESIPAEPISACEGHQRFRLSISAIRQIGCLYLDLVYPPSCLLCNDALPTARKIDLCSSCIDAMQGTSKHWCRKCGMPKGANQTSRKSCLRCVKQSFAFDDVVIWGQYQGALQEAVIAGKKRFHEPLTMALGQLLGERLANELQSVPDVITYVPSHWRRRMSRRTVPSANLAKQVGRLLRRPVWPILQSVRATEKQATLPAAKRPENILGAFAVRKRYRCEGQRVLVVDDVMTTGATFNEIAAVLKRAGAVAVDVAATARGVGKT